MLATRALQASVAGFLGEGTVVVLLEGVLEGYVGQGTAMCAAVRRLVEFLNRADFAFQFGQ